jgi:uncharacterized protein (DUF849 family)
MIPTKEMTPHVPITPTEIIEDIHQAWELGITIVHVHARDETTGQPTYKAEVYEKIISGIRKFAPDLVICVSLSGRNWTELEKRTEPLQLDGSLKPDMGSLTLSSLNFARSASLNAPDMVMDLASAMKEKSVKPELEAFDPGMINYAQYLIKKGLVEPPFYWNLILGNIASAQSDILHAGVMVRDLPPGSIWSIGGMGDAQLPMNSLAIAMGGGVRVGIEDNIYLDRGHSIPARNIDLVKRIHVLAEAHERPIMKPAQLREVLNMRDNRSGYGVRA